MQKLCLLFFTIFNFLGKNEPNKVNPNTATFDELISIPVITEEEALAIITIRNVKEFTNIEELIERTGIDSTKTNFLKQIFIFASPPKIYAQAGISRNYEQIIVHSKLTAGCYSAFFVVDSSFPGFYISNNWLTAGNFGLQISSYNLTPVFTLKEKTFNLCLTQPLIAAIGIQELLMGFPVKLKKTHLLFTSDIIYKGKADFQISGKILIDPLVMNAHLAILYKTALLKLHFNERNTNFSAQAKLKDSQLFLDCSITRTFKTGECFQLKVSSKQSSYASFIQYSRILSPGVTLTIKANLNERYPELNTIKISSKDLSISYLKGEREKVTLATFLEPLYLMVDYYPKIGTFEYRAKVNFAIQSVPFKIAIGWNDRKSLNLSFGFKLTNDKKRQSHNIEDR